MAFFIMAVLTLGCAGGAPEQDDPVQGQETDEVPKVKKERGIWVVEPGKALDRMIQNAEQPVVVQCYTPWCGKCRILIPVIERLAGELGDDVDFVKVNTADEEEFIDRYHVGSVPLVLFFSDGKEVDRLLGDITESEIRNVLEAIM